MKDYADVCQNFMVGDCLFYPHKQGSLAIKLYSMLAAYFYGFFQVIKQIALGCTLYSMCPS
jgi:hypothetical protein